MSTARSLFLFSKHRSRDASNVVFQTQRIGHPWRFQCCKYSKTSRHSNGPQLKQPVTTAETEASHSSRNYLIPALLIGGFAGTALLIHYNDERRAVPKGQETSNVARNSIRGPIIGGPFTLIDTEGNVVTERNLLGNWVLLYFGYTSSPDVGPEQVGTMARALDILEKQNVEVLPVFVSIDPQRDTPSHLRAYLKEFHPRIMGLTGPVSAVRQMAQEYRVYFRKVDEEKDDYLVESSHNMYLINPNLRVMRCFGVEYSAEQLSRAIMQEMSGN